MARQPAQTPLPRLLQGVASTAAQSRLYLAQTVSGRIAQSEFASVTAKDAAREAAAQTEAVRAAAAQALHAAQDALVAADAAYAQASAAASAGASASAAGDTANERLSVLEATNLVIRNGGGEILAPLDAEGPMGDMTITGDWGPFPLQCTFSAEVKPPGDEPFASVVGVELGLRTNLRDLDLTNRTTYFRDSVTVEITHVFVPDPGETTITVAWNSVLGPVVSPAGRRQLSVLRVGTP
jgi:cell wall-associated NlpC family hydrolase